MSETVSDGEATQIRVTGEAEYTVTVGRGLRGLVADALGDRVNKVLIVHTPTVGRIASELREELQSRYAQVLLAEVPDAEAAKRVEVAAFCWGILGKADFTRSDAVIGLGGGAVTDLAGFVAATWLRGVRLVQIPTSVLGMVDASVGGKTGINTAEGKNLVEFRRLVELAIGVKARVVSEDFREGGLREILNYGHTLGHAIEHAERYQWRHGVAISIGMVYAAELGRMAGQLSDEAVDRHRSVLGLLGLPLAYPAGRWQGLLATMQRDKKARAGMLRFIVLDDIGKPRVLAGVDESVLQFAYQEIAN